jgi:hypothetical protein
MRLALPLFALLVAVVALAGAASRANAADAGASDSAAVACVESWPEVRMQAYGYNHIVHLRNTCSLAADCVVTTDVNPEPTRVTVDPKSETEVNTFLGSPARVFTPKVVCTTHTH